MLLTLEAKDYGDVLDCAIRDRPGSWPTPEAVQDEEDVICHDPVRPTLVQFVLEIIARY